MTESYIIPRGKILCISDVAWSYGWQTINVLSDVWRITNGLSNENGYYRIPDGK